MKKWALLTIGLYVLVLAALTPPFIGAAFGEFHWKYYADMFNFKPHDAGYFWLILGGLGLLQAALLVVPVRIEGYKHVTTRHVVWTILAGAVSLILLAGTCVLAIGVVLEHHPNPSMIKLAMIGTGFFWAFWTLMFWLYAWRKSKSLMARMVNYLLLGSILELLIAIPSHIYVRSRHECCADMITMLGLASGIAIGLLAFGPAVFALFVRRVKNHRCNRAAKAPT